MKCHYLLLMGTGCLSIVIAGCGARSSLEQKPFGARAKSTSNRVPEVPTTCQNVTTEAPGSPPSDLVLTFEPKVSVADVLFLIDNTGSMIDEIDAIRNSIRTVLVPQIQAQIPDIQVGVASFADFPITPYGTNGASADTPLTILQPSTTDLSAVENAVGRIAITNGGDEPEATVEGLYQLATGEGLSPYIAPKSCPTSSASGRGALCVMPDSSPVILLFTDAQFHGGPNGERAYVGLSPAPHTFASAVDALKAMDAKVLGLFSGPSNKIGDIQAMASATGAVDKDGAPLVYDIGTKGEQLTGGVVSVVSSLILRTPVDKVDLLLEDIGGDAVDATKFVQEVVASSVTPESAAIANGSQFEKVQPGAKINFTLKVDSAFVAPIATTQAFPMKVTLRKNGVTPLAETQVIFTVPGTVSMLGCQ